MRFKAELFRYFIQRQHLGLPTSLIVRLQMTLSFTCAARGDLNRVSLGRGVEVTNWWCE